MMTFQPGEIVKAGHFGATLSNKGQEKTELQRGELMTILKISWYGDHVKVLSTKGQGWTHIRDCDRLAKA